MHSKETAINEPQIVDWDMEVVTDESRGLTRGREAKKGTCSSLHINSSEIHTQDIGAVCQEDIGADDRQTAAHQDAADALTDNTPSTAASGSGINGDDNDSATGAVAPLNNTTGFLSSAHAGTCCIKAETLQRLLNHMGLDGEACIFQQERVEDAVQFPSTPLAHGTPSHAMAGHNFWE